MKNSTESKALIAENKKGDRAVMVEHSAWQGPLPHPSALAKFEKVVPGSAERIIKMAEDQAAHRIKIEKQVVFTDTKNNTMGLYFVFFLFLATLGAGIYLIRNAQQVFRITVVLVEIGINDKFRQSFLSLFR